MIIDVYALQFHPINRNRPTIIITFKALFVGMYTSLAWLSVGSSYYFDSATRSAKVNAKWELGANGWHVINESSAAASCVNSSKLQILKRNGKTIKMQHLEDTSRIQNPVQNIIIEKKLDLNNFSLVTQSSLRIQG